MIVAPGQLHAQLLLTIQPEHWSLWDSRLGHLIAVGVAWRILVALHALRGDDRRERRDPLQQRRPL